MLDPNKYFVYKYTFSTGHIYIGQSNSSILPKNIRYGYTRRYKGQVVYNYMNKYKDYKKEILEDNISENDIDDKEIYYIKLNNSYFKNNPLGLNFTLGGQEHHGQFVSEETKEKKRQLSKQYVRTPEWKRHISEALTGIKRSPEFMERLRLTRVGHVDSEETKAKRARSMYKAVNMLDKNYVFIRSFESIREAEEYVNGKGHGHIGEACNKRNLTAYGYRWEWRK